MNPAGIDFGEPGKPTPMQAGGPKRLPGADVTSRGRKVLTAVAIIVQQRNDAVELLRRWS